MTAGRAWHRRTDAAWAVAIVVLLVVLFFVDDSEQTLFLDAFYDFGHAPLFGVIAVAVFQILRTHRPDVAPRRVAWVSFALVSLLGGATELLQFLQPNRDPSFEDLARDMAGAASFLLMWGALVVPAPASEPKRSAVGLRVAMAAAGVLILSGAAAHLAWAVGVYAERHAAVPVLYRLDGSWWERALVSPHLASLTPGVRRAEVGEPLARLDLSPGEYPGMTLAEPYPDWRAYRRLTFTAVSDRAEPLRLTLRVNDAEHDNRYQDRFNVSLTIAPGVNRIVIPIDDIRRAPDRREMDLSRIRTIVLFAYGLKAPARVFLGPLRLE